MGVFKWLRRERLTVTTRQVTPTEQELPRPPPTHAGTIRTEEYKRDLAEFQARRSTGGKGPQTSPVKRKCGRHSLPVSCTDCARDPDTTFNYEKKSAAKYKKRQQKLTRSTSDRDNVPNIQFLFQNQVFLPGDMFSSYSEPAKSRRSQRVYRSPEADFVAHRHIDFSDEQPASPPLFFKNNSLAFDVKNFLDAPRGDEVDGLKGEDLDPSGRNSPAELVAGDKDDGCEEKMWEVMSELRHFDQWADEQLHVPSANTTKSDDNKSDASVYGLPVTSSSDLSVTLAKASAWQPGKWGVVPVQIKKLVGVTLEHVKKKRNAEINILRKYRHPNIILLMGLFLDVENNVNIICERCTDSLYGILHEQGRILSAQTSVQYALDIANALLYLRMQGYIHTRLSSSSVAVTSQGAAKLADVSPCVPLPRTEQKRDRLYDNYSPEPQYVNIQDSSAPDSNRSESEPLLPTSESEAHVARWGVALQHGAFRSSPHYRWHAPELFAPDADGLVRPCPRSDVYSLAALLWECCNAAVPFRELQYEQLAAKYAGRSPGLHLPADGSYPGALLALLRSCLQQRRNSRPDLPAMRDSLLALKRDLDEMEYIIIPARLSRAKQNGSAPSCATTTTTTTTATSPTDSDRQSPKQMQHAAVVHEPRRSDGGDVEVSRSVSYPTYERLSVPERCFISDGKHQQPPEKDFSSACSTPIEKLHARIRELDTPELHKSDSTEYCSILSPESAKDWSQRSARLSGSFTPKSYRPLDIRVPRLDLDLDSIRAAARGSGERPSYNFDVRNYSLPTTPIARSNKLRKHAWLSGEADAKVGDATRLFDATSIRGHEKHVETQNISTEIDADSESCCSKRLSPQSSTGSEDTARNSFTGLKRVGPPHEGTCSEPTGSWSMRSSREGASSKVEEEALAHVYVKPLVAIHERWIHEANRKTGRSLSLPEDNRRQWQWQAVKPASHRVEPPPQSLPHLARAPRTPRTPRHGFQWDQYCQTRDMISKSVNFAFDPDLCNTWKKDSSKGSSSTIDTRKEAKVDQATSTRGIEDFIRDLIRRELQHLVREMSDDSPASARGEEALDRGVANVLQGLRGGEEPRRESVKSFSRVKINGNNKPLLQITFSRNGENSLQVLDNCVNVTICDGNAKEKPPDEDTFTADDLHVNSLKRCQAFNAIQEARSTEDLYIDDDLSAQLQENFGGKVKLIPLHGSLHEILCEKEDDCCLIKVKQENGCDTIYFRCDGTELESRDAVDGARERSRDTVVFKRSISLVEERVQRIAPKPKAAARRRPKSEVFPKISHESRALSSSSPSLATLAKPDEVEVNIESVLCYQDSSSDECLKCQDEEFELLEREIEADLACADPPPLGYGCLEKISEENLSIVNEEAPDKN